MSYLEQLRAATSETRSPHELTKPTKGASVSFGSSPSGHISPEVAHFRWNVSRPGAWALEVRFSPEATQEQVSALYPGAICEPLPDTDAAPDPAPDPRDDRRTCQQCANLSPRGRCLAAWRGERIGTARREYHPVLDVPWRCECYAPGPDDADWRPGRERWTGLVGDGERLRMTPA